MKTENREIETHMVRTEAVEAIEELAEQTGEDVTELASTLLNEALELIKGV